MNTKKGEINPEKISEHIQKAKPFEKEVVPENSKTEKIASSVPEAPSFPGPLGVEDLQPSLTAKPVKSQFLQEIEIVLAEDLDGLYEELKESDRLIFKKKGEETASHIQVLLSEATVKVREIFRLIVKWLKFLPGVDKIFIEQEAKIKTDKLLRFRNH